MLSSHPSPDALDRYRRGLLPSEELLAVDDHLAACASCREAALRAVQAAPGAAPAAVDALAGVPVDEHPEFEELAAYVDATQDDVAREVMETHLADCASCREEVADLRAFKAKQPASPLTLTLSPQAGRGDSELQREDSGPLPRPAGAPDARFVRVGVGARGERVGVRGLTLGLALALPAAAIIIWMLIPRGAVRDITPPPAADPTTARVEPGGNPAGGDPSSRPPTPTPPAAATVATLRDGGAVVTLDAAGHLTGPPSSLPQPEQTMLVAALTTGRMPLPELIRDLAAEGEVLRGSGGTGAGGASLPFTLHEPLGTAVESDRPRFRWTRLPSALAYTVSIYDEDFALVARSPELTSPEWICDRPLVRAKTYNWQVSAISEGATVTAPTAPAAAARFVVLDDAKARDLARLRQQHASEHLVMALVYARAGVRDAAERELRALQRDNPDAAIIRTLLSSLR